MSEKRVFEMLLPNWGVNCRSKLSLVSVCALSLKDITLPLFNDAFNNFGKQNLFSIVNDTKLNSSFIIPYEQKNKKNNKANNAKKHKPKKKNISYREFKN